MFCCFIWSVNEFQLRKILSFATKTRPGLRVSPLRRLPNRNYVGYAQLFRQIRKYESDIYLCSFAGNINIY